MRSPAFPDLLRFARQAVQSAVTACSEAPDAGHLLAVDATCGNGHDRLFLAETQRPVQGGQGVSLLGCDVQQAALDATAKLLEQNGLLGNARLLPRSHAHAGEEIIRIRAERGETISLCAAMYNLGFLPRSDKSVITRSDSTLASLKAILPLLFRDGLVSVHAYGGHPGGKEEMEAVDAWCADLPVDGWLCARYSMHNKTRTPEALFLIGRRE